MKDALRLSLPLTLWLISFSALYGLHGMSCAFGWDRWILILAAGAALFGQLAALVLLSRGRFAAASAFVRRTSLSLATVALIATIWTTLPAVVLPLCEPTHANDSSISP